MKLWLVTYGRQTDDLDSFQFGADVFRDEVDAYRWAKKSRQEGWTVKVRSTPLMKYP